MEVPREAVLASSVEWLEPAEQAVLAMVGVLVSRFLLAQPLSCQLVPRQVQLREPGEASPLGQLQPAQLRAPAFWPECEAVAGRLQAQPRAC